MKPIAITAFIAAAILMSSCGGGSTTATADSTNVEKLATADSIDTRMPVLLGNNNIQRKLIKTVSYDFKVAQVEKTAYEIDNLVKQLNGYTANSTLKNDIINTRKFPYSKDSLLEVFTYNTTNNITVYIPSALLDSAMLLVQQKIGFLNARDINVEDVSLSMLQNEMDVNVQNKFKEKMQVHANNDEHKLDQIENVQQHILDNDIKGNATVIDNIKMNDSVKYSEVNINLSQNPMISKTVISNIDIATTYKPSFGNRLQDAVQNGFEVCLDVIIAMANIWFVFVLLLISWITIRRRKIWFNYLTK
jgi:hypothetical protein